MNEKHVSDDEQMHAFLYQFCVCAYFQYLDGGMLDAI